MAAAEQVKMKMGDGFPAVWPVVDDEPVAGLIQLELSGDFLGSRKEMAEDVVVLGGHGGVAGVVLFGNEENAVGGLRGDVTKGQNVFVLIDDVGLGFAVDDPFEDRFGHEPSFLPDGQFEELGAEMTGPGPDKMDDLVVESLAGGPPRRGAGKGQDAGPQALQPKNGGKRGDLFIDDHGQTLEENHLQRGFFGEGREIDGGGRGGELEVAGNGGAADAGEGTAQDHFQGVALDHRANEIMPEVVENGTRHFRSKRPFLVPGMAGGFFQGQDQPRLVETGGLDSGGGDQGQGPGEGFFSGHRGF